MAIKLKEFYFLRHAQSTANEKGQMSGSSWDVKLSPFGHSQAEQVGQFLAEAKLPIQALVTSPLVRAQTTAAYAAEALKLEAFIEEDIKEWNFGKWEGVPFEEIKEDFFSGKNPPEGETRTQFQNRVLQGMNATLSHPCPKLIVAHGAVWMILQEMLGLESARIENATLVHVKQSNHQWILTELFSPD